MIKTLSLLLLACTTLSLTITACSDLASLRKDQQILPVKDYERMIVGRRDADYVGTETCLKKCHAHDNLTHFFNASVHGEQVSADTGLPLVNCESCHGPGSLAVEELVPLEQPGEYRCRFETLLPLAELPAQAQSLVCLKCHAAAATPTLNHWHSGEHAAAELSCFDCHKLHEGPEQKVSRKELDALCFECHLGVKTSFASRSHHPVPEKKLICVDCHNPHGTLLQSDLVGLTVKEVCTRCHMEYQGPFLYEHADVMEECTTCHNSHGSPNERLLKTGQPFLCLQCHSGHSSVVSAPALADQNFKSAYYQRCTDCHSSIHGSDLPSSKGRGTFIAR